MLSEFCIRRPVFTLLLMVALLVGGIAGYKKLAISALPRVDFPTIQVSASLPGASPETMASSVATPLERQFSTIAGVSAITSTSFLGNTQITLQFDLDRNIDGAALDVQTAISTTLRRLPREMTTPPSFQKVNPADQPVLFVAVSSDSLALSQVNEYADTLMAQRISSLPGVAQVLIYGAQKYAVRVQVDSAKLASQNITLNDIQTAISSAIPNSAVGIISGAKQLFNVKVEGKPKDATAFRSLILFWKEGKPITLGDIATVTDSVEDTRSIGFLNGKQAIILAIQRQPDANTIDVVERVRALLPQFRTQLPASIVITPMFDRSIAIRNSVHDVQITLLITVVLVVAVIFLFLRNGRATFIPAIAVPLSIITTYGAMYLFGFSINTVSLLALTLCVGFVVDDAIVMLENIMRYIEQGMKPFDAALKGSKEISFTILSITFSLVAVFIPVLFMGGVVGRLFREFAVTISFAVLVSGLISLTLTPMLASRMLKPHAPKEEKNYAKKLEKWFQNILNLYERSLRWTLHHRFIMLMITLASLVATIGAFILAPKGFFPLEDTGFVFAITEAPQDISYAAMVEKQKQVAEIVKADPAVANVFSAVGGGRGALNSGRLFFSLKPYAEREPVADVIQRLRNKVAAVQSIGVFMQPVQNMQIGGRLTKSLYQYTLQGSDLKSLYGWAETLEKSLKEDSAFQDVTTDLQLKSLQALVDVHQKRAASVGVTFEAIHQALYAAFGNAQVGTLYTPTNDYPVILETTDDGQRTPEDIASIYVKSVNGTAVPLSAVADVHRTTGPLSVNHQGQLAAVTLSFNLAPGIALSDAVGRIHSIEQKNEAPENIISNFQGAAQAFQDSSGGQGWLLLVTIIIIYIILGMLYESFIHPVTILSGLPSAGLGAVLTLMLFGMDISILALIGIILLIGIVKKNAIMMVDFAITARAGGMNAEDAIYQACILRFRPIMMTTMAAIFGTLPIAIGLGAGAETRQPLGIAVVGGLLTSQLLTLYITPVIYLYLERYSQRFSKPGIIR